MRETDRRYSVDFIKPKFRSIFLVQYSTVGRRSGQVDKVTVFDSRSQVILSAGYYQPSGGKESPSLTQVHGRNLRQRCASQKFYHTGRRTGVVALYPSRQIVPYE